MEERAQRIVETAVELAEEGGFDAVRLRDVAAHAGVAMGTLYRRFRSKEDLLLAALEQQVGQLRDRVTERPPEGATARERTVAFFQIVTRALCRRPNLTRALIRALATGEPELSQRVTAFHDDLLELIARAIRGAEAVESTPAELEMANILQGVWFASLIGWTGGVHDQATVIEQTRRAAELLLRAPATNGSAIASR